MQIWMRIQEEKKFLHRLLRIFLDIVAFAIPLPPNSVFYTITDLLGGGDVEPDRARRERAEDNAAT